MIAHDCDAYLGAVVCPLICPFGPMVIEVPRPVPVETEPLWPPTEDVPICTLLPAPDALLPDETEPPTPFPTETPDCALPGVV